MVKNKYKFKLEQFYEKEFNKYIKYEKEKDARFSYPHGNQRRKSSPEQETGKGQKETCGIITA
jgi:hypothetical protein